MVKLTKEQVAAETARVKPRTSKRGSANNKNRLDAFAKKTPESFAGWGTCHSELMLGVVTTITELGGAVTFGLSRDNGSHMLTLLLDGKRSTLWFNGDADLNDELNGVIETLVTM